MFHTQGILCLLICIVRPALIAEADSIAIGKKGVSVGRDESLLNGLPELVGGEKRENRPRDRE